MLEMLGYWAKEEKKEISTNVNELMTIYFALKLYIPNNRNSTARFFSDSQTALKYATKTGETESYILQALALQFQETTNECSLAVLYPPRSRESIKAD
ncbi:hypothetical protein BCV72DRAFT_225017 [Rhizopus microsporus var. microsporus]|nr:hypothetical protein BCV72DRAFT_225017 [Rhizopus microsporus var. microsporus]